MILLLIPMEMLVSLRGREVLESTMSTLNSSIPKLQLSIEKGFINTASTTISSVANSGASTPTSPQIQNEKLQIPQIRIFYANECVKAIKISGYKATVSGFFTPLPSGGANPVKGSEFSNSVEKIYQDPLLYYAISSSSFLSAHEDSTDLDDAEENAYLDESIHECSTQEISAILALSDLGGFKFTNAGSFVAGINCCNSLNRVVNRGFRFYKSSCNKCAEWFE
jgi:hypothetical protein